MSSLFSKPKLPPPPEKPKPKRLPTETDPEIEAAASRTRQSALSRSGRLSTILTDSTKGITGSSGQKLGA